MLSTHLSTIPSRSSSWSALHLKSSGWWERRHKQPPRADVSMSSSPRELQSTSPPLYLSLFNLRISFYAPSLRSELKTRIIRWNRYSEYVRIFTFAVGANILSLVGWVNLMERIGVVLGPKRRPEQVSDLLPRFPEWVGPGIFQVGLFTFVLKPTASSSSLQMSHSY